MPDIATQFERITQRSALLSDMTRELANYNIQRYWELQREWDEMVAIERLEDEVNEESS